ncbi:MAG: acyl-CoA dehydrogenase family protein [Firmicutes bacterium]|jgi:alkylation response protein AidB-like acyl-CoA dehydrogenase|nr:acyl-CoA dehydrogenase family protein [Bacillota bacterium]
MPYPPYFQEEHDVFRNMVRHFVKTEIAPYVDEWEEKGEFPLSILRRMGDLGLLGVHYPRDVGGQGGDYFMAVVLAEELARSGAGGFPMAVAVQTDMATPPIARFGSPQQIERYFKPALAGTKLACLGITEPNHGSDVASIETRAQLQAGEWIVRGSKVFITNGPRADFMTLVARTRDVPGYQGLSLFLLDLDRPGVHLMKRIEKVGMRSSDTALFYFDDVRIPYDALLGEEGRGFSQIMWELQGERLIAAAGALGSAQYAWEMARDYALQRRIYDQSLSRLQTISHLIAEMATEIEAVRQLTYEAAWHFSQGEVLTGDIAMAKLATAQTANWVIDRTMQIMGGHGYIRDWPIERMWRDIRLNRIGGGTDEIMKEIIATTMGIKTSR